MNLTKMHSCTYFWGLAYIIQQPCRRSNSLFNTDDDKSTQKKHPTMINNYNNHKQRARNKHTVDMEPELVLMRHE